MLDTCVINRILDGQIGNVWSLRGKIFVTDIQLQEVIDTKNPSRRNYLLLRAARAASRRQSPHGAAADV